MQTLKMQAPGIQYRLAILTCLLAFAVILMGAYVRLSHAGLGCPDWPGCYGRLLVPADSSAVGEDFGGRPLHSGKAWKEMIHRYLAGTLGLAILWLALLAWGHRKLPDQPRLLPALLLALVLLQAALGMWTVTLLVKPAIVTAHLLGGFATFMLLWLLVLQLSPTRKTRSEISFDAQWPRAHLWLALLALILQISLGGWTSSNYAALGCSEFPTCYGGQWWPTMDFKEAFVIWRGLGVNYEYGVLDNAARTAVHMTHRFGALLVLLLVGSLALRLIGHRDRPTLSRMGWLLMALLAVQIGLGVSNVLGHLPIAVAVAHNGGAALLLLTLVTLLWLSKHHA